MDWRWDPWWPDPKYSLLYKYFVFGICPYFINIFLFLTDSGLKSISLAWHLRFLRNALWLRRLYIRFFIDLEWFVKRGANQSSLLCLITKMEETRNCMRGTQINRFITFYYTTTLHYLHLEMVGKLDPRYFQWSDPIPGYFFFRFFVLGSFIAFSRWLIRLRGA